MTKVERWQLADDVLHSKIDEEVVIMSIANDRYYGLDPIASRVWELLREPLSLDELCGRLMEEYEVSPEVCRADTLELLWALEERRLARRIF
jgi:hypothetical protein